METPDTCWAKDFPEINRNKINRKILYVHKKQSKPIFETLLWENRFLRDLFCDWGLKPQILDICKPKIAFLFFGNKQDSILLDKRAKNGSSVIFSIVIKF